MSRMKLESFIKRKSTIKHYFTFCIVIELILVIKFCENFNTFLC